MIVIFLYQSLNDIAKRGDGEILLQCSKRLVIKTQVCNHKNYPKLKAYTKQHIFKEK